MSASEPMFPTDEENSIDNRYHYPGCSKLLYCMVHAPASEVAAIASHYRQSGIPEEQIYAHASRVWAEALIKESER